MIILGMDTSTTVASAAISVDDTVVAEFNINNKNTHSKKFMPMIESMFEHTDMDISDVDVIAVAEGPGSFTGLRIGMTIAKSLAYSLDKKIVGISSLELMANTHRHFKGLIVPTMDARRERVFGAVYRSNGRSIDLLIEEDAVEVSKLIDKLRDIEGDILLVGDGSRAYGELLESSLGSRVITADMDLLSPRASSLCQMVYRAENLEYDDCFNIVPNYLRDSQAQRQKRENKDG